MTTEDFKTPCCDYDTSRDGRTKSIIMWNPYNRVVSCHNCGTVFIAFDHEEAAKKTREVLAQAVRELEEESW